MINIKDISKSYSGRTVLNIASLDIPAGQVLGIVGNNGAGKTTLLRTLLGLTQPDTGEVFVEKLNTWITEDWKSMVAAYLDENFLIGYLTPQEYFDFIIAISATDKTFLDTAWKLIEPFTDESFKTGTKYIREFSTGNKHKIGIVGAMLRGCPYLVLDEPFANLDPSSQIRLKQILRQMNQQLGITILLSSHDLLHVAELCSRIILLENGKIIEDVPTDADTLAELTDYFMQQVK
ncbi:ATP-binding cassette domain-containing protein [Chitinophaga sp. Cy-1792]|uniref:ATP-binding cassette domain-containing protein n=1 Tax=Chitinophaga sp. Cy-1792 TaxID=2608339 RepID=UPI001422E15A|nr:ABC transporter ATP-binding protein [Chitinophaga sp. Cy-1792]NIG54891.1 ABC transporter ATP-binding protein [Chitinophaga sp. Cy-1792]